MRGEPRGAELAGLALPPARMAAVREGRPLKAWRYVAFFSDELIACAARVRVGPVRDSFWAVLDRRAGLFWHGRRSVALPVGGARIEGRRIAVAIEFTEQPGIETIARSGRLYAWTAKQAPLPAHATLGARRCAGLVIVDDTAAYYERHTAWYWAAGVGATGAGAPVAWNLVSGVNDPERRSERTVWVDGVAHEPPPSHFAADLSAVDGLRLHPEATLRRRTSLGPLRSDYRQPMGAVSGVLPGGVEVHAGLGVMERHDAWW